MNLGEIANEYLELANIINAAELRKKELKALAGDITGNSTIDVHIEDNKLARFRIKESSRKSCDFDRLKESFPTAYETCVAVNSFSYLDIRKVRA